MADERIEVENTHNLPITLPARRADDGTYVPSVTIVPGKSTIPKIALDLALTSELFSKWFSETGYVKVGGQAGAAAKKAKTGASPKPRAASTPAPTPDPDPAPEPQSGVTMVDITRMNVSEAVELVEKCDDMETLMQWADLDSRKSVMKAIHKRLKAI